MKLNPFWYNNEVIQRARFLKTAEDLKRIRFDRAGFAPLTFDEFKDHEKDFTLYKLAKKEKSLEHKNANTEMALTQGVPCIPFGGKVFSDGLHSVFAVPSVWAKGSTAPWPAKEEFKEEGDERHTSGFGRFLPIPRVVGNETVNWKQKAYTQVHDIDYVDPVAQRTYFDPVDDYNNTAFVCGEYILSHDEIEALKKFGEPKPMGGEEHFTRGPVAEESSVADESEWKTVTSEGKADAGDTVEDTKAKTVPNFHTKVRGSIILGGDKTLMDKASFLGRQEDLDGSSREVPHRSGEEIQRRVLAFRGQQHQAKSSKTIEGLSGTISGLSSPIQWRGSSSVSKPSSKAFGILSFLIAY
jgi:hypothetical protein